MTRGSDHRRCAADVVFPASDIALEVKNMKLYVGKTMPELQDVNRRIGSHSITCHPTQLNANQAGT